MNNYCSGKSQVRKSLIKGYVFDFGYNHRLCSGKSQVRKSLIIQQTIIKLFQEISSVKSNITTDGLLNN